MSTQLLDHNPDLLKLKNEGYDIRIIENNIIIFGIPYVTEKKLIEFGAIFCSYNLCANNIVSLLDHTMYFTGSYPCNKNGDRLKTFVHSEVSVKLTTEIIGKYYFSSKPNDRNYIDFYEKFCRYIELLSHHAILIDPSVKASFFDYEFYENQDIFYYPDTSSARAQITNISKKLNNLNISIIGLGGTGSYILDFVTKTHVKSISIFDGDFLNNHNAFRMPGVVTLEELNEKQYKVDYLEKKYSKFKKGIKAYSVCIDNSNLNLLSGSDFVFLSIDSPKSKISIINYLLENNIPFIDVGIGITEVNGCLRGSMRKTMILNKDSIYLNRIQIKENNEDDLYKQNIQISELNAMNAIQAIISWKKYYGFYQNIEDYLNSTFTLDEEEFFHES